VVTSKAVGIQYFSAALRGPEMWSLDLKEEMFRNSVLRKIHEPNREETTRNWRQFHDEELHSYPSPNSIM
jgi:hypothetical protein